MKQFILTILIIIFISLQIFSQHKINELKPAKMDTEITIINVAGKVKITGWEKEKVYITGSIERNVEKLEFNSNDNKIEIKAVISKKFLKRNTNIKCILDIKVPKYCNLNINFINSDISIANVLGNAKIKTVSGEIKNKGDLKNVDIETVSGEIKIEGNLEELNIESISGDINIAGISKYLRIGIISGDIKLEGSFSEINIKSISGDINIKNDTLNNGEFTTTSGDIILECNHFNKSRIDAQTTSGDIKLIIIEKIIAQFELETFSGNIRIKGILDENQESSFDNIDLKGKNKKIQFTSGSMDNRISMQTFSGDIIIKRNEKNK